MNTQEVDLDSMIDVVVLSKYNGKPAVTFNPKYPGYQALWVNQDQLKYALADMYLLGVANPQIQIVSLVRSIILICNTDAEALQIFLTHKK